MTINTLTRVTGALTLALGLGSSAFAQNMNQNPGSTPDANMPSSVSPSADSSAPAMNNNDTTTSPANSYGSPYNSGTNSGANNNGSTVNSAGTTVNNTGTTNVGGDVRAASPRIMDPNRPDYAELGIGPAFAVGLGTDQPLYDLNAAYLYNFNSRVAGKFFGDFAFGSSSDTARMITLGVGADMYLEEVRQSYGIPYVTADIGYGFARTAAARTVDAPTIGAGAGFKFAAQELNFDVALHYEVMTAQVDERTPSMFGLRAAMNF